MSEQNAAYLDIHRLSCLSLLLPNLQRLRRVSFDWPDPMPASLWRNLMRLPALDEFHAHVCCKIEDFSLDHKSTPNLSLLPALKIIDLFDIDKTKYLTELSFLIERSVEKLRELRISTSQDLHPDCLSIIFEQISKRKHLMLQLSTLTLATTVSGMHAVCNSVDLQVLTELCIFPTDRDPWKLLLASLKNQSRPPPRLHLRTIGTTSVTPALLDLLVNFMTPHSLKALTFSDPTPEVDLSEIISGPLTHHKDSLEEILLHRLGWSSDLLKVFCTMPSLFQLSLDVHCEQLVSPK